eukprot:Skav205440  [mRNA]  locus=scaffold2500:302921:303758:+ [translate_table: standard]
MLPARVSNATNQHTMFTAQCDTFLEMPALRWDVNVYYTDDPDSTVGGQPKSYTKLSRKSVLQHGGKHAGMFPDDEILGFDNQFFGVPEKEASFWAPCLRLCLEKSHEALQLHGYTKETMKGKNIALYNGSWANRSRNQDV